MMKILLALSALLGIIFLMGFLKGVGSQKRKTASTSLDVEVHVEAKTKNAMQFKEATIDQEAVVLVDEIMEAIYMEKTRNTEEVVVKILKEAEVDKEIELAEEIRKLVGQ